MNPTINKQKLIFKMYSLNNGDVETLIGDDTVNELYNVIKETMCEKGVLVDFELSTVESDTIQS